MSILSSEKESPAEVRLAALELKYKRVENLLHATWAFAVGGVLTTTLTFLTVGASKAGVTQGSGATFAQLLNRVLSLETKTAPLSAVTDPETHQPTLRIEGVNVQIVSGSGATDGTINGVGNLIIGYNEKRNNATDNRTGSHNLIVGMGESYASFGGLIAGSNNTASGEFATVTGGFSNMAAGESSSISGGQGNRAMGFAASALGGQNNIASGNFASVSGGLSGNASGAGASISGGQGNIASGMLTSISGGTSNEATKPAASVSGGANNRAEGSNSSVTGGESNRATNAQSTVTGGNGNTASGTDAVVSGGQNRTANGQVDLRPGGPFLEM